MSPKPKRNETSSSSRAPASICLTGLTETSNKSQRHVTVTILHAGRAQFKRQRPSPRRPFSSLTVYTHDHLLYIYHHHDEPLRRRLHEAPRPARVDERGYTRQHYRETAAAQPQRQQPARCRDGGDTKGACGTVHFWRGQ